MNLIKTNWEDCPDFIEGQSVGILWTISDGKKTRYHWNQVTHVLFRVIETESQPLGLCLNLDQALSIALQTFTLQGD